MAKDPFFDSARKRRQGARRSRHHRLDQCLHDYIEAACIADDVDGYLFRSAHRDRLSPLQHHSPDIRQVQNLPAVNLGVVSPIGMLLLELNLKRWP
jgi:hypothetical protein